MSTEEDVQREWTVLNEMVLSIGKVDSHRLLPFIDDLRAATRLLAGVRFATEAPTTNSDPWEWLASGEGKSYRMRLSDDLRDVVTFTTLGQGVVEVMGNDTLIIRPRSGNVVHIEVDTLNKRSARP